MVLAEHGMHVYAEMSLLLLNSFSKKTKKKKQKEIQYEELKKSEKNFNPNSIFGKIKCCDYRIVSMRD